VPKLHPESANVVEINAKMQAWTQGDYTLDLNQIVHLADAESPLTNEASDHNGGRILVRAHVEGVTVVSQTCEIVRDCLRRPYVQVVPLVAVTQPQLAKFQTGKSLIHGYLPGAAARSLVVDLDRVMTMEKSILARCSRESGLDTDEQRRRFAELLERRFGRFAFPDDFVLLAKPLQKRIIEKSQRQSDEGIAISALREIRVRAAPSWDADDIELTFYFVRESDDPRLTPEAWATQVEKWIGLLRGEGRFLSIYGTAIWLEDMSASDYVESDRLDLQHLSG